MGQTEKIAVLENEVESLCLRSELEAREIPFVLRSYHDSALNGIYQLIKGWGQIDAPVEHKEEILAVLEEIRREAGAEREETDIDAKEDADE